MRTGRRRGLAFAAASGEAGEATIQERLAAALPERRDSVFLVCRACHTIDEGGAHTSYTITFRPDETERHVYVIVYGGRIHGNDAFEGPETFELVLRSAEGAPIADGVGVGTITEGPMAPGVTVPRTRLALAEGGAAGHYSVAVNAPPAPGETVTVTVTVATDDPGAVRVHRGRAAPAPSTVLRFTGGETWSRPLTVTAPSDADVDDERVRIVHTVSGPRGWGVLSAPPLTVAVTDDDTAQPLVSIATGTSPITEGLGERMAAPRAPGLEGTLAGQALPGGGTDAGEDGGAANGRETQAALAGIARGFGSGADGAGLFDGELTDGGFSAGGLGGTGAEDRSMTGREALLASRFALTGEADAAGGTLALWGRAVQARFEGVKRGDGTDIRLDGEATTALLGADYARDRWLVGLALTQSTAEGRYESEGDAVVCPPEVEGGEAPVLCAGAIRAGDGTIEGTLSAAVPYAALQATKRVTLWGAAGVGAGEVAIEAAMGDRYPADTTWTMAAAGARGELLAPSSGPSLALTSDAFWAWTASEKTRELAAADSDVTRLRVGLEGSWPVALAGGARFTPTLETGLCHDGGDAETGFGVELVAGLAWSAPGLGLTLDLSGRTLLAHEDRDLEDRGWAASLRFDPCPSSERGLSLSLGQTLGAPAGGLDALFAPTRWSNAPAAPPRAAGRRKPPTASPPSAGASLAARMSASDLPRTPATGRSAGGSPRKARARSTSPST